MRLETVGCQDLSPGLQGRLHGSTGTVRILFLHIGLRFEMMRQTVKKTLLASHIED